MGRWMLVCLYVWPGADSILCVARLPPPLSLDLEKFAKEKKLSVPHLVLHYPAEKVSSREPELVS